MIFALQVIGLVILFLVLTYIYWRIFGRKLKNKEELLRFWKSSYNIIFWTILICNIIHLLVDIYTMELLGTYRVSLSKSFIICLLLLIIPKTLISCLETSIRKEQEEKEVKN